MPDPQVTIMDVPPPAPPPAPSSTVVLPQPTEPAKPPKPGSAREAMFKSLREKAVDPNAPPAPAKPATPTPPTPGEPKPDNQPPADPEPPKPGEEPKPGEQPTATNKTQKQNPWKLYEGEKAKVAAKDQEIAQLKERLLPDTDRQSFTERLTKAEARAKELEDEIRYVNYSKSEEFKTKYEAPYEGAWARAMEELSEIAILDPSTRQPRAVDSKDLLTLVNMPLQQARELANATYGDFADDVMAHRKEIRKLFIEREKALTEAKEKGGEREKLRKEQTDNYLKQVTESVRNIWKSANEAASKDERYGKYFNEIEGDADGNQRLGKGYQLVDRAFSDPSPTDPRLTPEQRNDIVRRHSAVRNRAAAFGRLVLQVTNLEKKLAAAEKDLAQYRGTVPTTTTTTTRPTNGEHGSTRNQIYDALRKIAK